MAILPIEKYKKNPSVSSDFSKLKKVLVHRPDRGIEMVTPSNAESLLYDDIVFLPQMKWQHKNFHKILSAFLGSENVIEFQVLLSELLSNETQKASLIKVVATYEGLGPEMEQKLTQTKPRRLAKVLITGRLKGMDELLFPPLPNFIFTRDIGVVVNDHLLTCLADKGPRKRESILAWFVFHRHPVFQPFQNENKFIDLAEDEESLLEELANPAISIEGGDVMVINKDHVFIGSSERTNEATISKVAQLILDKGVSTHVTLIDIPKLSTCIHLDTLFTQIAENDFVVYAPFMLGPGKIKIKQFQKGKTKSFNSFEQLLSEINPEARLIPCGGGKSPFDEREQYASGCNFVALKDGVAISYRRNVATLKAIKKLGYQIIKVE
ncbi:MAG: arginine deiminase family protein, partial [Cyclobacteriaceae bacterium]